MATMREFKSGATRDSEEGKLDYEGFLSPLALEAYARYLHGHRVQSDGALRASDNWQKGIPRSEYMKSLWRHLVTAWKLHRGAPAHTATERAMLEVAMEEALCGVLFNAFGYLHELKRGEEQRVEFADGVLAHWRGLTERNKPGTL